MSKKCKTKGSVTDAAKSATVTLADLFISLQHETSLSATRLRDLQSAVKRVASLLGQDAAAIPLDLPAISAKLAEFNPVAVGISAKTFANLRSGFLTALKVSGLKPVQRSIKTELSPAWANLMAQLLGKRAHLGLSRFARYASAHGIEPDQIDDAVIARFIAAVHEGSLHRKPNDLGNGDLERSGEAVGLPVGHSRFLPRSDRTDRLDPVNAELSRRRREPYRLVRWHRCLRRRCPVPCLGTSHVEATPQPDPRRHHRAD
jgi:hypothetical protein